MCAGTHVPKGLATAINLQRRLRGDLKTSAPVAMHYGMSVHVVHVWTVSGKRNCSTGRIKSLIRDINFSFAVISPLVIRLSYGDWKRSVDQIRRAIRFDLRWEGKDQRFTCSSYFMYTIYIYLIIYLIFHFNFTSVSIHSRNLLSHRNEVINMALKDAP